MTKPICEKCGNDGTQGALYLAIDARWDPEAATWQLVERDDQGGRGWDCLACDHVTPRDGQAALFPYGLALPAPSMIEAAPDMLAELEALIAGNFGQPRGVTVPALDGARAIVARAWQAGEPEPIEPTPL